jgi:hypothetical protein
MVTDTFRWEAGPGRFYSWCRSCTRERNRARSGGRARRVVATFLGLDRRYGVEFECIVPTSVDRYTIVNALQAAGLTGWRAKGDGSLMAMGAGHGIEVVSPILQGEQGVEAIRVATRVLRELGATVNRTCGTHIHHEARDLTVQNIKDAVKAWSTNQHLIDGLVAPSRRNGQNTYCRHLDSSDLARVDRCTGCGSARRSSTGRSSSLPPPRPATRRCASSSRASASGSTRRPRRSCSAGPSSSTRCGSRAAPQERRDRCRP